MSQNRKNYIDEKFMNIIEYVQRGYEPLKDANEIKDEKDLAAYDKKRGVKDFKEAHIRDDYEKNASRILDYLILRAPEYLNTLIGNNDHGPGIFNKLTTVKAVINEFNACIMPATSYLDNNTAYAPYIISDRLYHKMRWLEYLLYKIKNEEIPEAIVKKVVELAINKKLKTITARLDQYETFKNMAKRVPVEKFAEEQIEIKSKAEAAAIIENEKIAKQKRAEDKRIAEEKEAKQQAEVMKIAEEKAAKQQAEAMKIAEEKAAEQQAEAMRIAEEKATEQQAEAMRIAEEKAAEQQAEAMKIAEEAEQQRIEAQKAAEEKEKAAKQQITSTEKPAEESKPVQQISREEKIEIETEKAEKARNEPEQISEEKTQNTTDKRTSLISTDTQKQDDGFEQAKAKAINVVKRNLNDLILGRVFTFFRIAPDIRRAEELLTDLNTTKTMDELITLLAKFIYNGKTKSDTLVERSWTFKKTFLRRMVIDALCPRLLESSSCCFSPRLFASSKTIGRMLQDEMRLEQSDELESTYQAVK